MSKKGKKPKLPKAPLSEEDQLLIFQQKMLADEEAAKKKERLLTQFLKVMLVCSVSCPNPQTPKPTAHALVPLPGVASLWQAHFHPFLSL
jgi:hypothetical protein